MQLPREPTPLQQMLALICAVALLFPEVGHAFAHHHAMEHRFNPTDHQLPDHGDSTVGLQSVADNHGHSDHPHLDLTATAGTRQVWIYNAVFVRVAVLLLYDLRDERPQPISHPTGLSPGSWVHGPPPPSRAPPLV
jgi:hypothetical protein